MIPRLESTTHGVADDQGDTLVYDAWNRLVTVKDSGGGTIASYSYDGSGWRITVTESGATSDQYFSNGNLFTRETGAPETPTSPAP